MRSPIAGLRCSNSANENKESELNPEVKKLWTDALRSNRFYQGSGRLKQLKADAQTESGQIALHCCLGVLCELAIEAKVPDVREFTLGCEPSFSGSMFHLPLQVMEWAGLGSDNPMCHPKEYKGEITLSLANDDGLSFATIADVIETQL